MKKFVLRLDLRWLIALLLVAGRFAGPSYAQSSSDAAFLETLGELRTATYAEKGSIVEKLAQSSNPNVRAVLTALLEDHLYFRNDDQKVFLVNSAAEDASGLELIDPLSLQSAGSAPIDSLTKIGTNNHLRRVLETTLARFGLSSPDASLRLEAARKLERSLDEANVGLLRERQAVETDPKVKKEIATALALAALNGSDPKALLDAIATLRGSLDPNARNRLEGFLEKTPDGSFVESDAQVRQAAAAAVKTIDRWRLF